MRLNKAARMALPTNDFAIPKKKPKSGSYPIPDHSHAVNALARVSQFGSEQEKAAVRRKITQKFPNIGKK